jgi:hypothetical protein
MPCALPERDPANTGRSRARHACRGPTPPPAPHRPRTLPARAPMRQLDGSCLPSNPTVCVPSRAPPHAHHLHGTGGRPPAARRRGRSSGGVLLHDEVGQGAAPCRWAHPPSPDDAPPARRGRTGPCSRAGAPPPAPCEEEVHPQGVVGGEDHGALGLPRRLRQRHEIGLEPRRPADDGKATAQEREHVLLRGAGRGELEGHLRPRQLLRPMRRRTRRPRSPGSMIATSSCPRAWATVSISRPILP